MRRHPGRDRIGQVHGLATGPNNLPNQLAMPNGAIRQPSRNHTLTEYQREYEQGRRPQLPARPPQQGGPRRAHVSDGQLRNSGFRSAHTRTPAPQNRNVPLPLQLPRQQRPEQERGPEHNHRRIGLVNRAPAGSAPHSDTTSPDSPRPPSGSSQDMSQVSSPSYHAKHLRFASDHATLANQPQPSEARWHICPYCMENLPHNSPAFHVSSNISLFSTLSQPPTSPVAITGEPRSVYNGFHVWGLGQINLPLDHNDGSGCTAIELNDVIYVPDYPVLLADDKNGWHNRRLNTVCLLRLELEGLRIGLSKFQGWAWLSIYDEEGDGIIRWIALAEERADGPWELVLCRREGSHEAHRFQGCKGGGDSKARELGRVSVVGSDRRGYGGQGQQRRMDYQIERSKSQQGNHNKQDQRRGGAFGDQNHRQHRSRRNHR